MPGAGLRSAPPGRTITVVVTDDVGAPLERAFPSATYAHAAAADAEQRWDDADACSTARPPTIGPPPPTPAPRARSRTRSPRPSTRPACRKRWRGTNASALLRWNASRRRRGARSCSGEALEDGRLLRAKLMATRAVLGRAPPELYARTRARLEEARDNAAPTHRRRPDPDPAPRAATPRPSCLLCATYAIGGDAAAARLARAHVPSAARADPANAVALAACAAALGETDAALAALESFVLRPLFPRSDIALRDVYLANDWDHLRGDPRFESLFR